MAKKEQSQLRKVRLEADMSIAFLTAKTGLPRYMIDNMDNGANLITGKNAMKLSKALGVKIIATAKRETW